MIQNLTEPLQSEVNFIINGKRERSPEQILKPLTRNPNTSRDVMHRIIDLSGSLIALVLLTPIILMISLAIYISSGAPVFFRQKRLGKGSKPFTIYKFRTMRNDAEEILKSDEQLFRKYVGNDYKLEPEDDLRITRFGRFLRRSSLDEVPQFFNVIKGDMSIVGPRPIVLPEIERYDEHAEEFLSVKPGVTGLWQVTGRSEIAYPERKYVDLIYAQNKSIVLDLKIMLKTLRVVIRKVGAH